MRAVILVKIVHNILIFYSKHTVSDSVYCTPFAVFVCFSLIPSLYTSLKSEGHSFVSDEVVSFVMYTVFLCIFIRG